jgi:hypothetical protein
MNISFIIYLLPTSFSQAWNTRSAMTEIPRIAVESAEEFHQQYANKNKPVIVSNFQDGWADKEKFTRAGLSEQVDEDKTECMTCLRCR